METYFPLHHITWKLCLYFVITQKAEIFAICSNVW
jgi:hypothetical protein